MRVCHRYLLALICAVSFLAFKIPPAPNRLVFDSADLLGPQVEERLESFLEDFERSGSNQLVVATFPSLEGEALEDLTLRIAEAWKPGYKDRDNGAMLFVFKDDRAIRIEVGYGLEDRLTDAVSATIIHREMIPRFREGKFEEGIIAAVDAMMKASAGAYKPLPAKAASRGRLPVGVLFLFALLFLGLFRGVPWPFWLGLGLGGMGGGHHRHSGGGFGGGFGGFGGGSFGGGGASGRW